MGLQHSADKEVEVDEVMTSHIPHLVSLLVTLQWRRG